VWIVQSALPATVGGVVAGGDGEVGAAAVVHPVMNARRTTVITTRMGMIVLMSFIRGVSAALFRYARIPLRSR
jgi:hypothetical protein